MKKEYATNVTAYPMADYESMLQSTNDDSEKDSKGRFLLDCPRVSVIIVNYNGAPFLDRLLSSMNDQTFKDFEVIIVDNASKDDSLKVVENLFSGSSNFNVIRLSQNYGYCEGNNIGLEFSKGEYIVLLNNDTYVSSTWLENLVKVMDENHSVGACQSNIINYVNKQVVLGNFLGIYGRAKLSNPLVRKGDVFHGLFYASGACVILRRKVIEELGYLFDSKQFTGDMDLGWRVRLIGFDVATSLGSLCYHFQGYSSRMVLLNQANASYVIFKDVIRTFIKNYSGRRFFRRSPLFFGFLSLVALYESMKFRAPCVFSLMKAIVWNTAFLKDSWTEHLKVQASRKISDDEIENAMLPYPAELYFLRLKLIHTQRSKYESEFRG